MTTSINAGSRLLTTHHDVTQARDVLETLEGPDGFLLVGRETSRQVIPREIGELVQRVLQSVARGDTITVSSVPDVLTTSTAAEMLGISRPTLMKLIAAGDLPAHKVGTHTRIHSADVFAFLRARQKRQQSAFDELRELLDT